MIKVLSRGGAVVACYFDLVEVACSIHVPATNVLNFTRLWKYLHLSSNRNSLTKYYQARKLKSLEKSENGELQPRHYDAIQFFVGYNKDRASALVEVKDAKIELFEDENHNLIEYTYQGEIYLAAQVVYDLGKVIEKHV